MSQITVLGDDVAIVDADITETGQVLLDRPAFAAAVGWEAKPQGLCQGDVCVPYGLAGDVLVDDKVDLLVSVRAIGRPAVAALDDNLVVVGQPSKRRSNAVDRGEAAPFELPNLNGETVELADFRGKRKLLVAFASW